MNKTRILYIVIPTAVAAITTWFLFGAEIKEYYSTKGYIEWEKNVSIDVTDYAASIDKNSNFKIYWWHGIVLKAKDRKVANAKVYAVFDRDQSWVKDTADFASSNRIQKMRFDLFEVYARKFNDEIDQVRYDKNTTYEDLELIGDRIYSELEIFDDEIFDSYTDHNERYEKWRPVIDSLLVHGIN